MTEDRKGKTSIAGKGFKAMEMLGHAIGQSIRAWGRDPIRNEERSGDVEVLSHRTVGPFKPWKRFRYPSIMEHDGQRRLFFYSNWKSRMDIFSGGLTDDEFTNITQVTKGGGNYGPKVYKSLKGGYILVWHKIHSSDKGTRSIMVSMSDDLEKWTEPKRMRQDKDNCYPSLVRWEGKEEIIFSSGNALFARNKDIYIMELDGEKGARRLDIGDHKNIWRADSVVTGNVMYIAYECEDGIMVKSSEDLVEWDLVNRFPVGFIRPRLSLGFNGEKLLLCMESFSKKGAGHDIVFQVLTDPDSKIISITDDMYDNMRPGTIEEIEEGRFILYYTSDYRGLEGLLKIEFRA